MPGGRRRAGDQRVHVAAPAAGEDPTDPGADARLSATLEVRVRLADVLPLRVSVLAAAAERRGAHRRVAGYVDGDGEHARRPADARDPGAPGRQARGDEPGR